MTWRSMQFAKTGLGQGWTELPGVMHAVKQVHRQQDCRAIHGRQGRLATPASCLAPIQTIS